MAVSIDVLALGNAIVDVIAQTEDNFLVRHNIAKGAMNLIDEARAELLYGQMGQATIISGGSAANTAAGIASFGSSVGFIGKVKSDAVGAHFSHDIRAAGVTFATKPAIDGPGTARSFIMVTPDGERSMNTYLGACQNLTAADVDETQVRASGIVYLEGYLWDPVDAKEAFRKAADIAHANGSRVALTLSDSFCVDRYRDEFLQLVRSGMVDILFANEHELKSLYGASDFDTSVSALRQDAGSKQFLGVVTRSEAGAIAVTRETIVTAPAFPVDRVIDTTGAGDLFAAGFLHGLGRGRDSLTCLKLGALAASEIISHIGARPLVSLANMAQQHGLIK
jgi:sugar/nucleoside kinase (ribokinase family)